MDRTTTNKKTTPLFLRVHFLEGGIKNALTSEPNLVSKTRKVQSTFRLIKATLIVPSNSKREKRITFHWKMYICIVADD